MKMEKLEFTLRMERKSEQSLSKNQNTPNSLLFSCGTDIRQIYISQWPYRSQYDRAGRGYTYRWPIDQKEMLIILISRKLQAICGLGSLPGYLCNCFCVFVFTAVYSPIFISAVIFIHVLNCCRWLGESVLPLAKSQQVLFSEYFAIFLPLESR